MAWLCLSSTHRKVQVHNLCQHQVSRQGPHFQQGLTVSVVGLDIMRPSGVPTVHSQILMLLDSNQAVLSLTRASMFIKVDMFTTTQLTHAVFVFARLVCGLSRLPVVSKQYVCNVLCDDI